MILPLHSCLPSITSQPTLLIPKTLLLNISILYDSNILFLHFYISHILILFLLFIIFLLNWLFLYSLNLIFIQIHPWMIWIELKLFQSIDSKGLSFYESTYSLLSVSPFFLLAIWNQSNLYFSVCSINTSHILFCFGLLSIQCNNQSNTSQTLCLFFWKLIILVLLYPCHQPYQKYNNLDHIWNCILLDYISISSFDWIYILHKTIWLSYSYSFLPNSQYSHQEFSFMFTILSL